MKSRMHLSLRCMLAAGFTTVLLVCSITTVASIDTSETASTYQLSYDGIVSPTLVTQHASNLHVTNSKDVPSSVYSLVLPKIARDTLSKLGSRFVRLSVLNDPTKPDKVKDALQQQSSSNEISSIDPLCIERKGYEGYVGGTKISCLMEFATPNIVFDATIIVQSKQESYKDYIPTQEGESNYDKDNTSPMLVVVMVDITMSSTIPLFARDALVESIPILDSSIDALMAPCPVWKVQERHSPIDQRNRFQALNSKQAEQSVEGDESSFATAIQASLDKGNPASLEVMILSNPSISSRSPIVSSSSKVYSSSILTPMATYDNDRGVDATTSTLLSTQTDIWSYQEEGMTNQTKSLFYDSTLRATTSYKGIAHAEAFILPGLIANAGSTNVLIISQTPLAYIQQVMKYKTLEYLAVAGADIDALELTKIHMPELNDCNDFIGSRCLDDERVNFVEDMDEWFDVSAKLAKDSFAETYDLIFIDVPPSANHPQQKEWLSKQFHEKLAKIMNEHSVVVVSAGTSPSDVDFDVAISSNLSRDGFLHWAFVSEEHGGFGYEVGTVYDEPSVKPFDDAFIILFNTYSEAWYKFIRKHPTSIDFDMMDLLYGLPNKLYDGPTHIGYVNPSRAWENWYCRSNEGKALPICGHLSKEWYDRSRHTKQSRVEKDPIKGRKLVAVDDIPKGSFILADDASHSIRIDSTQWDLLNEFVEMFPDAQMYHDLKHFIITYGFEYEVLGSSGWTVSIASNNTFTNHACTELEANVQANAELHKDIHGDWIKFSPILMRRTEQFNVVQTLRDISKGEEIAQDYSVFRSGKDEDFEKFLSDMCQTGVGLVPVDESPEDKGSEL